MASSTSVDIFLDETALIECRNHGEFDRISIGDFPTSVHLYLGQSDETAVNTADRLIEALQQARTAALARIVKGAA